MAMMPKRVLHRKQQRGVVKGDAQRGNTVEFGDFWTAVHGRRVDFGPSDRGSPSRDQSRCARSQDFHPDLPPQANHIQAPRNSNGQG